MRRVSNLEASDLVHPDQTTSQYLERENVRFKEVKKKRLRKKPRETVKKIEVARHFGTDRVDVVGPCECVIDGDSQELEGANLFNLTAIVT